MAPLSGRRAALECRGLSVGYAGEPVVSQLDLQVGASETVCILGPSGSGKTTLLYALAGFLAPTAGEIQLAGQLVASPERSTPPEKRSVAMVFQHYGLWPHMDALQTVAYPLRRAGLAAGEAHEQARRLLAQLHIDHLARRRPAELSGGEQQRVGLARALARRPAVYLLDEPTAHLDTALKAELQAELALRLHGDQAAAVYATHDVEEALALADRLVLLRAGRIVQQGTPSEVYERPVDEWAARLTGPLAVIEDYDGLPGRHLVRPDWLEFGGPLAARITSLAYRGSHTDYNLATAVGELLLRQPGPARYGPGDSTTVHISRTWQLAREGDQA